MSNFGRNANGSFEKDSSFYTLFHGAKTILLEDELNEFQWNQIERLASMTRGQYSNGMMTDFEIKTTNEDDVFYLEAADSPFSIVFDGYDLKVGNNKIDNQPTSVVSQDNRLVFKLPHNTTGYDVVFLEAWFEVMNHTETIRKFGGIDTPEVENKMYDERVARETSRRIQFRWRVRSARNVAGLSDVVAQNYDGTNTAVKFTEFDDIFIADLGVQKDAQNDVKTLGKVYAMPLFKVARSGYKITIAQITDMMPKSRLRLLKEYDISKIAHATSYVKMIKVQAKGASSTIGDKGLWVDGQLVHYGGRSYCLVVMRRADGEIVFSTTYDVYNSTTGVANANNLAAKLASYDSNYIVILYTFDEPKANRLQPALVEQIQRCGGGPLFESQEFKTRGAYILIGVPGSGEGKGIELYTGKTDNDTSAYTYLTTFIVDGDVLSGGGSTSGGTAMDKRMSLAAMSDVENTAEILRGMGASGLYAVRQYGIDNPFQEQTKVYTVSYNTIGEHNHPNFRGMPGLPELALVINGYYMRTRHNDYRMYAPKYKLDTKSGKGQYLYREETMPPAVPAAVLAKPIEEQYTYMKNVHTTNPQDCEWNLAYLEVWWEKLTPELTDYSDSFRHQINQSDTYALFADHTFWSISGLKNRAENVAFFPVSAIDFDENGKPVYLILRYRINTKVVSTLKDTPFNREKAIAGTIDSTNRFTLVRDLQVMKRYGYGDNWGKLIDSGRARFKCADLAKFMEKCPGIDGDGAPPIYESVNRNGNAYDIYTYDGKAQLNAVNYNHDYSSIIKDASGRSTGERSFSDPNLFTAKTVWDEVVHHGYSYAMPLELILRTPRESWNPYNIPVVTANTLIAEKNAGKGSTSANPYSGYNIDGYNFTIPADLYQAIDDSVSDVADTANNSFLTGADGVSRKFMASGIKIYDYDGKRMRFPVYAEFHEYTKGSTDVSFLKEKVKEALLKLYQGTMTEQQIKDLF